MMNRKIFAVFLAFFILLMSTGCQLAREDMAENRSGDKLIGVFITKEYLDLFDIESYFNDNIHKISPGGSIAIDGDTKKYEGRLYANIVTRTNTDPETGSTFDTRELAFEGVEGLSYFCAKIPASEEEGSYTVSSSDEGISDGHTKIHYGDEEDSISLEGTIYFSPVHARSTITLYMNPVYQSSDGRVYAVSGSGLMLDGNHGEGMFYSQTLEETTTTTENQKSKSSQTSVKISFAIMYPPKKVVVLQMDDENNIISKAEYQPGKLPDTIKPDRNTAYIMVENHKQDREGNLVVSRSLYDESKETLDTYYSKADGILVKQWTALNWNRD